MDITKNASFTVDHRKFGEGLYISRIDGDVVTYDMRTRRPNAGDYMDNITMHTVEHLFATYVRSSAIGEHVIYFGPMGCQTGFYLLVRDAKNEEILAIVKDILAKIIAHDGPVPGASRIECGNYKNLSLEAAKTECARYLAILSAKENDFTYPQ